MKNIINFEKDFLKENYSLIINKNNIEINVHKEKKLKKFFLSHSYNKYCSNITFIWFLPKRIHINKKFSSSETYISFSPDCKLLAIGTIYGKVMIINV